MNRKNKPSLSFGKLQRMVRFFHFRVHIHSVWGVGIAMGPAGMSAVSEDWKYLANIIEWKVFLGPILLRGVFPYRIRPYKKPTYCQQSNDQAQLRSERLAALEAENTALKSRVAELETLAAEMLEPWRDGNTGYMAGGYILKLKYKRWMEVLEKRGGIERNQNHATSAKPEASK